MTRLYTWNFLKAFLAQTAFTVTNSLLAHYARWVEFLGGDILDVGSVSSVSALVGLLCRPVLATWIDRAGPRRCWCISGVVVMAATLANIGLTEVGPMLYLLRSIMAVGIAVVFASGLTYIAHVTPIDRRAEAIGVLGAGGFAGLLIGPPLGDLFLADESRTYVDFVWYFATAVAGVGISIFFVLIAKAEPIHASENTSWHPILFVRTARRYWPGAVMMVTLAFGACMTIPFVFMANFVDHVPGAHLGPFFVVYASVGLAIRLGLRSWPDQFGPMPVLAVGMSAFAVGMWLFIPAIGGHHWWILAAGAVCGLAHGLTFHSMVTLVLEPFPPENRGVGSTLALLGLDTGTFLGAQILRFVIHLYGYQALFHSVAVFCLFSIAYLLLRGPRKVGSPAAIDPAEMPLIDDADAVTSPRL